ncbi:MAG TPA: hypothetical protein VEA60_09915, partial [Allosphingosinicella sp.]|nr:hypothetical protein [Allosphingosinicella sp.]
FEGSFLERDHESISSRHIVFRGAPASARAADDLTEYSREFWLRSVRQRLNQLLHLRAGWDGYDAPRISYETAIFVSQILQDLWRRRLKAPQISPLSSGGLMVEWLYDAQELTLEIERPYAVSLIYEDEDGAEMSERVGADLGSLSARLDAMIGATQAAAA